MTDEEGKVTDFNDKYLDMWRIPREVLEGGATGDVRAFTSRNFADPQGFSPASRKLPRPRRRASTCWN